MSVSWKWRTPRENRLPFCFLWPLPTHLHSNTPRLWRVIPHLHMFCTSLKYFRGYKAAYYSNLHSYITTAVTSVGLFGFLYHGHPFQLLTELPSLPDTRGGCHRRPGRGGDVYLPSAAPQKDRVRLQGRQTDPPYQPAAPSRAQTNGQIHMFARRPLSVNVNKSWISVVVHVRRITVQRRLDE